MFGTRPPHPPQRLNEDLIRDLRMGKQFRDAKDSFAQHCVLIEWMDGSANAPHNFRAWQEGPQGFRKRVDQAIASKLPAVREFALCSLT